MNRGLNLPAIQKIMNEFERESSMMDMKEEMMSDAVDDVMDDELEDEEEEGDKILKQVLDEIGVDLDHQVCIHYVCFHVLNNGYSSKRRPLVLLYHRHLLRVGHQLRLARLLRLALHGPLMINLEVTVQVAVSPTKTRCKLVWML